MNFIKITALAALLVSSASTCKNSEKTASSTPNTPGSPTSPAAPTGVNQPPGYQKPLDPSGYKAAHAFEEASSDTVQGFRQIKAPPQQHRIDIQEIKAPNASRRAYLATGWWFPKMAYQPTDSTIHHNYLGKYLKFREDQTFDIIQSGKVVSNGLWNFDEDKYVIYLACSDPYLNNTWKVMEKGFTMIWMGQTSLNFSGIQIRMDNIKTAPF